ncbi:MAG: hypothetical protein KBS46_05930 [Clostridiales bacterium]|nr:hypothetical protein [Candidatus Apopatocola equi]
MLGDLIVEYRSIFIIVCLLVTVYGCYCRASANSKEKEKRLKGTIEAVCGAIGLLIGLLTK